jgi:hypothetical protein
MPITVARTRSPIKPCRKTLGNRLASRYVFEVIMGGNVSRKIELVYRRAGFNVAATAILSSWLPSILLDLYWQTYTGGPILEEWTLGPRCNVVQI